MQKRINKQTLKKLKPCEERYKNYLKYHSKFNGSLIEFLGLENITYEDKLWVAAKFLNKEQTVLWSIKCVESVLYIFEKRFPEDSRPRDVLNAAKNSLLEGEDITDIPTVRAGWTAWSVSAKGAAWAAWSVGAIVRTSQDNGAMWAIWATGAAINAARETEKEQKNLNLKLLKEVLYDA